MFRDCDVCPQMVPLPGGDVALGRYEVTLDEYRVFAEASTEVAFENNCFGHGSGRRESWRDPGYVQTGRQWPRRSKVTRLDAVATARTSRA